MKTIKSLQITEDEARELFFGLPFSGFDSYSFDTFKNCLKSNGFMGRTALETSYRNYYDDIKHNKSQSEIDLITALENRIEELES